MMMRGIMTREESRPEGYFGRDVQIEVREEDGKEKRNKTKS